MTRARFELTFPAPGTYLVELACGFSASEADGDGDFNNEGDRPAGGDGAAGGGGADGHDGERARRCRRRGTATRATR